MKKDCRTQQNYCSRRKCLTLFGVLALFYPVLQFVGFNIPKKPTYVEINKPVPASGYLTTTDFILFDRDTTDRDTTDRDTTDRDTTYWALSRKCTHLGCKLNYHEDRDILECPCHQSRFNVVTGEVVKGPAEKPLTFLPVEKRQENPLYVVTI
jgi:Rieske Fe-S protein